MKSKFFDALLYIVAYFLIQMLVSYAVFFCWAWADGQSMADIKAAIVQGDMQMTGIKVVVTQVASGIITLVLFLACRWSRISRDYLRSKPVGVLFWAAVATLGTIIPSEVFVEMVPLPDFSNGLLDEVMLTRGGYLAICIFAPLVEELVFRGAVLRVLLESMRSHWVAIALSALLFAAVHANPVQMPHAFCLGLLLGWMYYRTGSVVPGIMVHWVNNTVAYAVYNIFPQYQDAKIVDMLGGSTMKVGMAVAFSLMIFLPALLQLHLRMHKVRR